MEAIMTDPFDSFLAAALAPPNRSPDRQFVGQVQARIALEDRLRAVRRAGLRRFALEALALCAVAGGLLTFLRSEAVATLAGQLPGVTLLGLLAAFGLLVALLSVPRPRMIGSIKLNG
jgi:hypothetical protein